MAAESSSIELKPIEALDRNILNLCNRINVATYELLVMIREFDERCGWLKWGMQNCAEWLAWRCDFSMTTALEKVRVAHALKGLPAVSQSFSVGELSYSKVRALTRVANRKNEEELLAFALRHSASHVAERCRERHCGTEASTDTAARAFANRSLRMRRDHQRGMMTITVELPMDTGELLEKALDKARDDECLDMPDLVDTSWSTRQTDALTNVVKGYLGDESASTRNASNSKDYLVTVHVDQSALASQSGRSSLPIESMKRICCDSQAVVLTENDKSEPLNIGRKTRIIPKTIERALHARDNGCCRFPGCKNRRYLHGHHIKHWSDNGETSLENLMLLCTKHHTLVHEGGFRIAKDFQDRWYFQRPDGIAVPECGYSTNDTVDDDIYPLHENPPAGGMLSVAENTVNEPPAPVYLH